jgi:peptide deformylase
MDSMKIVRMGDPLLRRVSATIADPTDPDIRALAESMVETMIEAPGVGLAAPQVARGLRLIVMRIVTDRAAAAGPRNRTGLGRLPVGPRPARHGAAIHPHRLSRLAH